MCGLKRVKHLFTAAAAPYEKRLLKSLRICHYSAGIDRKRRKWVPQELSGAVVTLTCESSADCGVCNVYLVGSNHDCPENWQIVRAAVQFFKPEVVFLELCSSRLTQIKTGQIKTDMVPTIREMVDMWKKNHKPSWILYKWYMAKINNLVDGKVLQGGDFRAAYEEAMKCGARVIIGDIHIDITLQKYLARSSLLDLVEQKSCGLPPEIAKKLKGRIHAHAVDQSNENMAKKYPALTETFLHERDLYMSAKLLEVAREYKSVVAVVGKGHIPGMKRNWKKPIDVEQLLIIPSEKKPITVERVIRFIRAITIIVVNVMKMTLSSKIKRSRS